MAVKLECGSCATPHLVPYRCGARACPTCARAGAAQVVERIAGRVDQLRADLGEGAGVHGPALPWDGAGHAQRRSWRLVTLTTRAGTDAERWRPEALAAQLRRVRRAFGTFWRLTSWGRQVNDRKADGRRTKRARWDTAAALGLEVAPGGMVHLHVAIYGEFVAQRVLSRLWARALGELRARVDVRTIRGDTRAQLRKGLAEVLKYATKGHKAKLRAYRAAIIELAFRNVRRVEMVGALRRYGDVSEDVQQEDLHATKQLACETCEARDGWVWVEIRGAELVRENLGFGRLEVFDAGRRSDRRCYLGDPPPWEADDGDSLELLENEEHAAAHLLAHRYGLAVPPLAA